VERRSLITVSAAQGPFGEFEQCQPYDSDAASDALTPLSSSGVDRRPGGPPGRARQGKHAFGATIDMRGKED
jgi:hypothetical protein